MCGLISSRLLKKNLYGPIFRIVGDMGVAFGSIYLKLCRKALDKKSPPQSRDGLCYEIKSGGVLLSLSGTGFQPVNPMRISAPQAGTPAPLRA
jgi:hypothetical protein